MWRKNDPLSATACMPCGASTLNPYATCSFFAKNFQAPAHYDGSGIARYSTEPCAFVRPPAAPGRVLFQIPDRLTESVPKRILLLQTVHVSIH